MGQATRESQNGAQDDKGAAARRARRDEEAEERRLKGEAGAGVRLTSWELAARSG